MASEGGIVGWMSSIRTSMAKDPCRQLFEDQIQNHGFIFLEDYLDNILTGPTQGPIIDLVKTPGRKKAAPHRTRSATTVAAKAKNIISLSLEEEDVSKENYPPVNSFHKALLQAQQKGPSADVSQQRIDTKSESSNPRQQENRKIVKILDDPEVQLPNKPDVPELTVSSPPPPKGAPEGQIDEEFAPYPSKSLQTPFQEHPNDLSVIAEGDESPERNRHVMQPQSPPMRARSPAPVEMNISPRPDISDVPQQTMHSDISMDHEPVTEVANVTSSSSCNTFQSILLNSPEIKHPEASIQHVALHYKGPASPEADDKDDVIEPVPIIPSSHSAPVMTTMTAPISDSPRTLPHKSSVPQFPSLPAPSPLRKSMRVAREPSVGPGPLLATTVPAAPALGKRTSWLMKAREVKAMEGASGRKSALGTGPVGIVAPNGMAGVPGMSSGVKRKSGDMLGAEVFAINKNENERKSKTAKISSSDSVPTQAKRSDDNVTSTFNALATAVSTRVETDPVDIEEHLAPLNDGADEEEGFMGRLKRTVEGMGARSGKSMGKSLGGAAAAAALAEARAAAEARVAERNKPRDSAVDPPSPSLSPAPLPAKDIQMHNVTSDNSTSKGDARSEPRESERRLSLSDLISDSEKNVAQPRSKEAKKVQPSTARTSQQRSNSHHIGDESTSTTPPNSPPSRNPSFPLPIGPVFNKKPPPPVVFMPPVHKQSAAPKAPVKDFSLNIPVSKAFALPAAMSLGVPARFGSPPSSQHHQPSTQSSQASVLSDAVFDRVSDTPAWMPSTQDTEDDAVDSESVATPAEKHMELDDDDSWPLEEKLAGAAQGWTPFNFNTVKEDSMTWSTLPTESQRGDTAPIRRDEGRSGKLPAKIIGDVDDAPSDTEDSVMELSDLDEMALEPGQSTVNLVDSNMPRSQSQLSVASTASSSQSQAGFFSQASKLVNTMLGGSKKSKPEVKSLQLAAVAAKKQQEEMDKKATRLKEMENRRQLAIQRKAEEEKTRALEEEKKIREEGEKRKREREEHTDKRPLKATTSKKVEEDPTKKRKLAAEVEKKEVKKPPSKDKKDIPPPSKLAKPSLVPSVTKTTAVLKSVKNPPPPALVSSTTYNASQTLVPPPSAKLESKVTKITSSIKGKGKAKPQEDDMSDKLPSQVLQTQMQARAKAQMQAAKLPDAVPSESIELPDINSEYSDSEDEDRVRTFDPPGWAQSPELRQALQTQSTVNPDDIFGAIRPLRMEELFRTRQSRFRARTSSANWSGTDRLTVEEEREYVRRMGFH
ncbi:hypothetical protein BJ138DRAFT_1064128 [Hygrophoropsis aurantiaca]|uniref:Uncharacterized protein n=1 Tax=Hygrophoropsis aurantiaca TaxID=72124 RepID=A0ACB8ABV4_9AGAM|nr:hypothetical protein BJ138DRAFT_1064128 [Hygrophoropsis aurantiaca]